MAQIHNLRKSCLLSLSFNYFKAFLSLLYMLLTVRIFLVYLESKVQLKFVHVGDKWPLGDFACETWLHIILNINYTKVLL